ncbi:MAG TPA: hypothetical protein VEI08_00380 [Candidatus Bathyarchaeia archaeon]|nr:hypothetical protein [Candidatus Bathyarchaeia archaeon]
MLADLFVRRNGMATASIIGELERIHEFYEVPSWAPSGEQGGYFYQIVKDVTQASLPPEQVRRLVAMLLWPELRAYKDRNGPTCLVMAALQAPSETYIPALDEHVAWLEEEIKSLSSSQYRTDVASEIRLAKGAIQACRVKP